LIYRKESLNSLAQIFGRVDDPRDNRGKRHRLIDIFILAVIGMLWGHTDFTNMCIELKYHEAMLKERLGLPNGIPSHDRFSAAFSIIEPAVFLECFIEWLGNLARASGYHVAIDGKAVRAACDKVHKGKVPYLVNAFVTELGLCIGQLQIDEKTNEIKGIPELMKWLDLDGAVVTIDAIGCQREIAAQIIEKGGSFILPAKGNQPTLHSDILLEMQTQIAIKELEVVQAAERSKKARRKVEPEFNPDFDEFVRLNKGHGRIERRSCYVLNDVSCVDGSLWPHVQSIGLIRRERLIIHRDENGNVIDEEFSDETETYIMSLKMNAETFACHVRDHWKIENSLHWVLDDWAREDRCTARIGHATENLGALRRLVYNLMSLDRNTEKMSKRAKQVYYRNDIDAVFRLLFEYVPGLNA
jgi:predicted transposase YbfD/YdcC